MTDKCSLTTCDQPSYSRGYCSTHYQRLVRRLERDKTFTAPRRATAPGPLTTLGVRVRASTATELEKVATTATTGARMILEAWAKRRK